MLVTFIGLAVFVAFGADILEHAQANRRATRGWRVAGHVVGRRSESQSNPSKRS